MRIGEVAERSGVSVRMLRHYDELGLVRPEGRTSAGYREYSAADLRRILHVEALRALGLSLAQVGHALEDPDCAPAAVVEDLIARTRARIAAEEELMERLRSIASAGPEDWEEVLDTVGLLRALRSPQPGERQRAALAAGVRSDGDPEAVVRVYLAEDETNVAGTLRWALRHLGEGALAPLRAALRNGSAEMRLRAVNALEVLDAPQATALLLEALESADPHRERALRVHAALALAASGHRESVPALIWAVSVGERDVEAAEALGRLAHLPDGDAGRIVADVHAVMEAVGGSAARDSASSSPEPAGNGVDLGAGCAAGSGARLRLIQALGELRPEVTAGLLEEIAGSTDAAEARIAQYLLTRNARPSAASPSATS